MNSTMNTAKDATQNAMHEVKGSMMDVLKTAGEVMLFLRRFGVDDALGAVGLARRPGPFASAGAFASGVVVGAGLGMLFAPKSGAETRAFLLGRVSASTDVAAKTVETVEKKAIELEHAVEKKVTDLGHRVEKVAAAAMHNESGADHNGKKAEHHVKSAADKLG